ncbi:unnamed protein product [Adineta steineri]|uniref:B box-type domain-containing protein n=1 Tax=Adineta steineri TaxID=433720 RepID=A0A814E7P0_9BILA|nr:unnamed protein product [Adineta steineri]CAF0961152.1 unnamed protein product [Adineta steineri]CAF0965792.1 unnamed protein product [Adineta steineri]CAF3718578.1 unnamed protein product [Adineta steineri]CAF3780559.1 unnamed protein product [Adineta steineri]
MNQSNSNNKKQCVVCNKSGGILICDGCQKTFCGKHVIEHRQDLSDQLDSLMEEHDSLQHELEQPSMRRNSLLQKIDRWEKDSITKIQIAAESARRSLLEFIDQSKPGLRKAYGNITDSLRAAREDDDFSEYDLDHWKKQLKDIEAEITSPAAAKLTLDKGSPIYLMAVQIHDSGSSQSSGRNEQPPAPTKAASNPAIQERFLQTLGPVRLEDGGYLAKQSSSSSDYAYIRGRLLYLRGTHTTRFRLEKFKQPYYIFFGCMSSKIALQPDAFRLSSAVGWFGSHQVYEQGLCSRSCKKSEFNSNKIQTNDVISLTFDCAQLEIRLFHERMKTTCTLAVDQKLTPFPWQLLVVLCNSGDAIRVLPNA